MTLNNIGQIYSTQDDYSTALYYLEQSLKISQEIGDRKSEGATLNNIGQIYENYGDYATALHYLEQSLEIRREISDNLGVSNALHNIALIAHQKRDIKLFMKYEKQAWKTVNEIGDAMGIFTVGYSLGCALCLNGQKAQGLPMLHRSYDIAQRNGLLGVEQVKAAIDDFS